MKNAILFAVLFVLASSVLLAGGKGDEESGRITHFRFPLLFTENAGQWNRAVRYAALTPTRTVLCTASGIALRGTAPNALQVPVETATARRERQRCSETSLRFVHPSQRMTVTADEKAATVSRFYLGRDARRWRDRVSNFGRVTYGNVWRGISVSYTEADAGLTQTITVQPGADASAAVFRVDGDAALTLRSAQQMRRGVLVPVHAQLRRRADGAYTLSITGQDPALPVVVSTDFSTYFGGSGGERGAHQPLVRMHGSIYLGGTTWSVDLLVHNAYKPRKEADFTSDAFLASFTADGKTIEFCTYYGGKYFDGLHAIQPGMDASIVAYGNTDTDQNSDFPLTPDAALLSGAKNYISRFSEDGFLLYSSLLWDAGLDIGEHSYVYASMATDACGNVYLFCNTRVTPPMTTADALFPKNQGGLDAFIMKLAPTCDRILYATCFGGKGDEYSATGTVDLQGNIFVSGMLVNGNGFPLYKPFQIAIAGGSDLFISKLSSNGRSLVFSTFLGGSNDEKTWGGEFHSEIATDDDGNIYVGTSTLSPDFPVRYPYQAALNGSAPDCAIAKFSPAGDLLYGSYLGGSSYERFFNLCVDHCGNMVIHGETSSADFPLEHPRQVLTDMDQRPYFIAILDSTGQSLAFATHWGYYGGSSQEVQYSDGTMLISGWTTTGPAAADSIPIFNARQATKLNESNLTLGSLSIPLCSTPSFRSIPTRVGVALVGPDTVLVDSVRHNIRPDRFPVALVVRNADSLVKITQVGGRLHLPRGIVLSPPTQQDSIFIPSLGPRDSLRFEWTVAITSVPSADSTIYVTFTPKTKFEALLQACEAGGTEWKPIVVHYYTPPIPEMSCALSGPDSLSADGAGTGLLPNPMTFTYTLRNISTKPVTIRNLRLKLPAGMGLSTVPVNTALRNGFVLAPGAVHTDSWTVHAATSSLARTVTIAVAAVDTFSWEFSTCTASVFIPSLPGSTCAASGPTSVSYFPATGRSDPDTVLASVQIDNRLDTLLHFRRADIDLRSAPHLALAAGETASRAPFAIAEHFRRVFTWRLAVAAPVSVAVIDTVAFWYASDTDTAEHLCSVAIPIVPRSAEISCALLAPDSLSVDGTRYVPNPFPVRCIVRNTGTTAADLAFAELTTSDPATISISAPLRAPLPSLAAGSADTLSWTVTAMTTCQPRVEDFSAAVHDVNGLAVSNCTSVLRVPGIPGALSCSVTMPDTLQYDLNANQHSPDPFPVSVVIGNALDVPMDSIETVIDVASAPHLKLSAGESAAKLITSIAAHASQQVDWSLTVASTPASNVTERIIIRYRPLGDTAWKQCERDIVIEGGERVYAASCSTLGHDTVWADVHYESIIPRPVQLQYTITNTGNVPLGGCSAAIVHSAMYTLVNAADSMQNYSTILPGASASREWLLEVNPDRATPSVETIRWVWNCDKITSPKDCMHDITMLAASPNAVVYSPWLLRFEAERDAALPSAKEVRLWTGGAAKMPWQLGSSTAWLGYQPASGVDSARIAVAPATTALSPGSYSGRIDITAVPGVSPVGFVVLYEITTKTGVDDIPAPSTSMLGPNYPNPANGYTTIPLSIPTRAAVQLALYDVYGRRVALLHEGMLEAGQSSLRFDASALEPGMYFVKLVTEAGIETRVMVVGR